MPLEGNELTPEQIADLTTWIKDGAAWPAVKVPASLGKSKAEYEKLKKEHWAWQPLTNPAEPSLKDTTWARDDLTGSSWPNSNRRDSSRRRCGCRDSARRLAFDRASPTPAEIDEFARNSTQHSVSAEQFVDRLLASPQSGARWGRHCLMCSPRRTTGPWRTSLIHAWKYDYVIDLSTHVRSLHRINCRRSSVAGMPEERDRLSRPRISRSRCQDEPPLARSSWTMWTSRSMPSRGLC